MVAIVSAVPQAIASVMAMPAPMRLQLHAAARLMTAPLHGRMPMAMIAAHGLRADVAGVS